MRAYGSCFSVVPSSSQVFRDRWAGPEQGYETPASRASLELRFAGQVTPFGTSLVMLWRMGGEMLYTRCGGCQFPMEKCRCDFSVDATPGHDRVPRRGGNWATRPQ